MKQDEMLIEEPAVHCNAKMVPIEKLKPNPNNPNVHPDEQIEMMIGILRVNGWRKPIIVSKRSGMVVVGHGRLQTAIAMKLKKVPVEYQDYADDQAEMADMISDNRIAQHSYVDALGLGRLLKNMSDAGQKHLGYTQDEIGIFTALEYVAATPTDRKFQVLESLKMTKDCKAIVTLAVQRYCLMIGKEIDWGEAIAAICLQWESALGPMKPVDKPIEEVKKHKIENKPEPETEPENVALTGKKDIRSFNIKYTAGTLLDGKDVFVVKDEKNDAKYYTDKPEVIEQIKRYKEANKKLTVEVETRGKHTWIIQ